MKNDNPISTAADSRPVTDESEGDVLRITTMDVEQEVSVAFVCDVCDEPIRDLRNGAAVFREHPPGVGPQEVLHVHLGRCQVTAEKLVRPDGPAAWTDLPYHGRDVHAALTEKVYPKSGPRSVEEPAGAAAADREPLPSARDVAAPTPSPSPSGRKRAMTPDQIEAADRKDAAYHEAGHAVACLVSGGRLSHAELRRTDAAAEVGETSTWGGRAHVRPAAGFRAVVGLAGNVAEAVIGSLDDGCDLDELCEGDLHELVCGMTLSETDRGFVGDEDLDERTWDAIDVVLKNWPAVTATAEKLIARGYVNEHEIQEAI